MWTYKFQVRGLPPKKSGEESIWESPTESLRVRELRLTAAAALRHSPPLTKSISLVVHLHVPNRNRHVAELDAFVSGVWDGLSAAVPGEPLAAGLSELRGTSADPRRSLAIGENSQVVRIEARSSVDPTSAPRYEIELHGE